MKIQVLELPTEYVGEYSKTPYAERLKWEEENL